jgi:hypothetical protein
MNTKSLKSGPEIIEDVALHLSMMIVTPIVIYNAFNSDEFFMALIGYGFAGFFGWALLGVLLKGMAWAATWIIKQLAGS